MTSFHLPTLQEALAYLAEAQEHNPGPWVEHSKWVARAAQAIAAAHPELDPGRAYTLGLIHDLGRREGVTGMRHVLDGYRFLQTAGYEAATRICLTHSFPLKDRREGAGAWDGSEAELQFVRNYLDAIEYTDYDRLIQLCDSLALPTGYCLVEKRLVDVALRYGVNEFTVRKWRAILDILKGFEQATGGPVYRLLPGVVENTF